MVTGAMSKAGGSVGGFKRIPETSQRVDGRDSGPSIRFDASRFCRCEQTKWRSGDRCVAPSAPALERNIVVEVATGTRRPAAATAAVRRALVRRLGVAAGIAAGAAAVEHRQFAAEALQDN